MTPFLDDSTVAQMCEGYKRNADRVKHLRAMGLTVATTPKGKPLVLKSNAEVVLGGMQKVANDTAAKPVQGNKNSLILAFGKKTKGALSC